MVTELVPTALGPQLLLEEPPVTHTVRSKGQSNHIRAIMTTSQCPLEARSKAASETAAPETQETPLSVTVGDRPKARTLSSENESSQLGSRVTPRSMKGLCWSSRPLGPCFRWSGWEPGHRPDGVSRGRSQGRGTIYLHLQGTPRT